MMKRNLFVKRTVFALAFLALILAPNIAGAAYVAELEPNNTAATAQSLDAYFSDDISYLVETDAAGTIAAWSASVYGFSGDSTYDYYSFSVGMGNTPLELNEAVAFDIDFAYVNGLDCIVSLYDTNGSTILAYNDDNPVDGPGDVKRNTLNSFLTYTFTTPGVYYIRVSQFSATSAYGSVLSTDATYHLHVATAPEPASLLLLASGLGGLLAKRKRSRKNA
jgi:hypothetical protein